MFQAIARNLVVEAGAGDHDHVLSTDDHLTKGVGMLRPQQPAPAGP